MGVISYLNLGVGVIVGILLGTAGGIIWGNLHAANEFDRGRTQGIAETTAVFAQASAEEKNRQDAAAAEAAATQAKRVWALTELLRQQTARLEELNNEAASDPDAHSCGISADGMRRVLSVR